MKKIFVIVAALMLLSSCSNDFLDLAPQHYSNEATFFKNESQFTQALNGAYSSLRGVSSRQGYLMGEMRSDNTHYTRYKSDRGIHIVYRENIADFTVDSQNQWVSEMWTACYRGISRANTIISRLPNAGLSESFTKNTMAQAKFIRAFFYFQLVQCYGGVPLELEEVKSVDNAFIPSSTVEEVYDQIIADATEALNLPVVQFPQSGAATQGAAKMLLAYAFMTKPSRDYGKAEGHLKDILSQGYELLSDYADVFDPSKKNGKESIFEIQYQMGDQGQQSNWIYYFIPKTKNAENFIGVPNTNNTLTGGWNVPTSEMISSYESGDLRLKTSIAVGVGRPDGVDVIMFADGVLPVGDPAISNYEVSYPFINKYRHKHAKQENTDDNWPVYRYADALLLLSECLVEQGKASEAVQYVNQVRTRAGLSSVSTITADIVANERRHELAFENHRWYDLLRTGKAIEVMTAYGKYIKTVDKELTDRTYNITADKLLYPIPYRELQINKALVQNPGY